MVLVLLSYSGILYFGKRLKESASQITSHLWRKITTLLLFHPAVLCDCFSKVNIIQKRIMSLQIIIFIQFVFCKTLGNILQSLIKCPKMLFLANVGIIFSMEHIQSNCFSRPHLKMWP